MIVILSHYLSGPVIDPLFETFGLNEPSDTGTQAIIVGIIIFGAAMTAVVVLLLRMDWNRVLGRVLPWTVEDDEEDNQK